MGYFDALTSSCFKTAQDGRKLFFPWGVLGRGYVIASERDYERLRRQIKVYTFVTLVTVIIGTVVLRRYLGALVIAALLIAFYVIFRTRRGRRCPHARPAATEQIRKRSMITA